MLVVAEHVDAESEAGLDATLRDPKPLVTSRPGLLERFLREMRQSGRISSARSAELYSGVYRQLQAEHPDLRANEILVLDWLRGDHGWSESTILTYRKALISLFAGPANRASLDWQQLVGTSVLRRVRRPDTGAEVDAFLQILWPSMDDPVEISVFTDDQIWQAATFDVLIRNGDRRSNNFAAVPRNTPTPLLVLFDHGFAFNPGSATGSVFSDLKSGDQVPAFVIDALRQLVDGSAEETIKPLISADAFDALIAKANDLIASGVLEP